MKARRKTISIILAVAFVIAASIYGFDLIAYPRGHPCDVEYGNSTSVSVSNCQVGITLTLSVRSDQVATGGNMTATFSLRNDLSATNFQCVSGGQNVGLASILRTTNLTINQLDADVISENCTPAGIMIRDGSGAYLQLSVEPSLTWCGSLSCGMPFSLNASEVRSLSFSVGGFWTFTNSSAPLENSLYSPFSPGQYSVIAYAAWVQPITLNFTVG